MNILKSRILYYFYHIKYITYITDRYDAYSMSWLKVTRDVVKWPPELFFPRGVLRNKYNLSTKY